MIFILNQTKISAINYIPAKNTGILKSSLALQKVISGVQSYTYVTFTCHMHIVT